MSDEPRCEYCGWLVADHVPRFPVGWMCLVMQLFIAGGTRTPEAEELLRHVIDECAPTRHEFAEQVARKKRESSS